MRKIYTLNGQIIHNKMLLTLLLIFYHGMKENYREKRYNNYKNKTIKNVCSTIELLSARTSLSM